MTFISTQRGSDLPTTVIMAPPWVPLRWATSILIWIKVLCTSMVKIITQYINAMGSQSTVTESHVAVQVCKTKQDKSTITLWRDIRLYSHLRCVAELHTQIRKSNSDIESLISTDMDLTNSGLPILARNLLITSKISCDVCRIWNSMNMMSVQCKQSSHA